MWRAFFLSLGIYSFILGIECLVVEKAVLAASSESTSVIVDRMSSSYREVVPPEWAPWSLMSGGAVVVLYSFTIPRKLKS